MSKNGIYKIFKESANVSNLVDEFSMTRDADRLDFIHKWSKENAFSPVIASSFGDQSILLLGQARRQNGFEFPIVTVDILDKKYDQQRQYRDYLHKELGLNLFVFQVDSFEDKVPAMDRGLLEHGFNVVVHGVRASQTKNRQSKSMVEFNPRNSTVEFFPLLDWPDAKAEYYVENSPKSLKHPNFGKGKFMQGGAEVEEKTECGLHI